MAKMNKALKKESVDDAIELLKADHKKAKKLFRQFGKLAQESGKSREKATLVAKICLELTVHTQIEEKLFYPAVEKALDEQALLDEAEVEHASAKELIGQLQKMKPADDLYDAKVTVLGEYVKHHIKEEENEMFPKVSASKLDTQALGKKMTKQKKKLMSQLENDHDKSVIDLDNKQKNQKQAKRTRNTSRTTRGRARAA